MNIHPTYILIISIFIGLDIVTGLIKATISKSLSSQIMREGLFHKLSFYLAYALALAIEFGSISLDLGYDVPLAPAVTVYICFTEIISIVENLCEINPEIKNSKLADLFKTKE